MNAKLFNVRVEHELFAGDERNVQKTSLPFDFFSRNALDENVTFEQGAPDSREIIAVAHQFGALTCEVSGSLPGHFHRPTKKAAPPIELLAFVVRRRFAKRNYMREKNYWRIFFAMPVSYEA